jgi:DNA damage-binding protein 2
LQMAFYWNSIYLFVTISPAHGTRLLITDQHSELKIFSGPLWNLETKILHPHRHFQHISPIKVWF